MEVRKIYVMDGDLAVGCYRYKKENNRFFCEMPECKLTRISTTGAKSLNTIRDHSRQVHGIQISIKYNQGKWAAPLRCQLCNKSFTRPQTLRFHLSKLHQITDQLPKDETRDEHACHQPTPSVGSPNNTDCHQPATRDEQACHPPPIRTPSVGSCHLSSRQVDLPTTASHQLNWTLCVDTRQSEPVVSLAGQTRGAGQEVQVKEEIVDLGTLFLSETVEGGEHFKQDESGSDRNQVKQVHLSPLTCPVMSRTEDINTVVQREIDLSETAVGGDLPPTASHQLNWNVQVKEEIVDLRGEHFKQQESGPDRTQVKKGFHLSPLTCPVMSRTEDINTVVQSELEHIERSSSFVDPRLRAENISTPTVCCRCFRTFTSGIDLCQNKQHFCRYENSVNHVSISSEGVKCPLCLDSYFLFTIIELKKHLTFGHKGKFFKDQIAKKQISPPFCFIPKCRFKSSSDASMIEHIAIFHDKLFYALKHDRRNRYNLSFYKLLFPERNLENVTNIIE